MKKSEAIDGVVSILRASAAGEFDRATALAKAGEVLVGTEFDLKDCLSIAESRIARQATAPTTVGGQEVSPFTIQRKAIVSADGTLSIKGLPPGAEFLAINIAPDTVFGAHPDNILRDGALRRGFQATAVFTPGQKTATDSPPPSPVQPAQTNNDLASDDASPGQGGSTDEEDESQASPDL